MKKKLLSVILVLAVALSICPEVMAAKLTNYDTNAEVGVIECMDASVVESSSSTAKNVLKYKVSLGAGETAFAYPIHFDGKGSITLMLYDTAIESVEEVSQLTDFGDIVIELYSGQECSEEQKVSSASVLYMFSYMGVMNVKKGGDYFIKISFPNAPKDKPSEFAMMFILASGENQTLKTSGTAYSGFVDNKPIYYKYTAKKDGYISLQTESASEKERYKITLCDKKKKALSKAVVTETKVVKEANGKKLYNKVFAVQKGTYYLKVVPSYTVKEGITSGNFSFEYKFTGVTDSSKTTKAKAKSIKLGKTVNGLITCTEQKADWYKFNITKAKKATITLNKYFSSGDVKIEIYNSKGKKVAVKTATKKVNYSKQAVITSKSSLAKGTYYIKLTQSNKQASGYYNVKVK